MQAAKLSENLDDDSESSSSENGSGEKMNFMPKRLSASFTKFDIFERERLEEERKRIREKRKLLLEEEKKLFEEAKLQEEKQNEDEKEYISETHQVQVIFLDMGQLEHAYVQQVLRPYFNIMQCLIKVL